VKPYPKNNEPRTFGVRQAWLDDLANHIRLRTIGRNDLLFTTRVGTLISRNFYRTQVWLPGGKGPAGSTSGSLFTTFAMSAGTCVQGLYDERMRLSRSSRWNGEPRPKLMLVLS
jgi:hypothetical protein